MSQAFGGLTFFGFAHKPWGSIPPPTILGTKLGYGRLVEAFWANGTSRLRHGWPSPPGQGFRDTPPSRHRPRAPGPRLDPSRSGATKFIRDLREAAQEAAEVTSHSTDAAGSACLPIKTVAL